MAEHETSEYILGGNTEERERIDSFHESTVDYTGRLMWAPVDYSAAGLRILDSGCAGGRWLRDLQKEIGNEHHYVGTDITETFFPHDLSRDRIAYSLHDITSPWPQDWTDSFDFVHQRFVLGGVREPLLKAAVMGLISLVKPGGWVEMVESDVGEAVVANDADGAAQVWRLLRHVYMAMGVEPDPDKYLRGWFQEAGLVDIHEERVVIPAGAGRANPEMGRKSAGAIATTALHLVAGAKQLGAPHFSSNELDALPLRVIKDVEKGATYSIYVIWGRRPH